MQPVTEIEQTADGTATLYRRDIDEHYHSMKGAGVESEHVYVRSAFMHFIDVAGAESVNLLEVGFGTGLNFIYTLASVPAGVKVHYLGLEKHPLPADVLSGCGYAGLSGDYDAVCACRWNCPVEIKSGVVLEKRVCDFTSMELPRGIDVVYFDAFAPEKQPEMWLPLHFSRLFEAMSAGGVLTTYCAKGEVRRRLQAAGFVVERLDGPRPGKREMLRATKPL